jgi:CBS domain-containing protein
MKIGDIMTESVISVRPTDRIADAIRLMLDNRISGLPVIGEDGKLVGIVSESDLLRRIETGTTRRRARWLEILLSPGRLADEYVHTHGRRVDEVMTRTVISVTETSTLEEFVQIMEHRRIKRLPVVSNGKVVGIVTRANLLQALAALDGVGAHSLVSDAGIRRRILDEIKREPWAPRYNINVVVRDGNVDLWGSIFDERERQALRVIVENVPEAKEIHDHILTVEPLSGTVICAPDNATA